ncbi:unnamed protein product [Caenorhabditis nigoni]
MSVPGFRSNRSSGSGPDITRIYAEHLKQVNRKVSVPLEDHVEPSDGSDHHNNLYDENANENYPQLEDDSVSNHETVT